MAVSKTTVSTNSTATVSPVASHHRAPRRHRQVAWAATAAATSRKIPARAA